MKAAYAKREPLPAGTVIEYCEERATVVMDDGGERIDVEVDGTRQRWWWTFEGLSCSVVSKPGKKASTEPDLHPG